VGERGQGSDRGYLVRHHWVLQEADREWKLNVIEAKQVKSFCWAVIERDDYVSTMGNKKQFADHQKFAIGKWLIQSGY
jgi:hypothetical protein